MNVSRHSAMFQLPRHPAVPPAWIRRTRVHQSAIGVVEDVHCAGARPATALTETASALQICLPYQGLFGWSLGSGDVFGDANQVLCIPAGETYAIRQPLESDCRALIITPDPAVVAALRAGATGLRFHPLLRRRRGRAGLDLQLQRARVLSNITRGQPSGVTAEQLLSDLLRAALDADCPSGKVSSSTRGLVGRATAYLHANLASPIHLADIAGAVGGSPVYLTEAFRRVEGIPLHRYLTQLRLAQALVEVPHASDLTTLALALGFSSHSHFSAAFRSAFQCTPSQFRHAAKC